MIINLKKYFTTLVTKINFLTNNSKINYNGVLQYRKNTYHVVQPYILIFKTSAASYTFNLKKFTN